MARPLARQGGFTLIEVITVVVILSITAVISAQLVVNAVRLHQVNQSRGELINASRPALERMTRQLRGALPYTVRVTDGGDCLQFFPIAGSGHYLGSVMFGDPVTVGPHSDDDFWSAQYISVGALSPAEVYGGSPASLAAYGGDAAAAINGNNWLRDSFSQRFYLVDSPQAFCVSNDQLRFYAGLDPTAANVLSQSAASDLLAGGVSAVGAPFAVLDGGATSVNLRVVINLAFSRGGEQVTYNQEVMLRNVP